MEDHWLFVFLLIFLRLTTATKTVYSRAPDAEVGSSTVAEAPTTMITKEAISTEQFTEDETKEAEVTSVLSAESTKQPCTRTGLPTEATDTPDRNADEAVENVLSSANEIDATENSKSEIDSEGDEIPKADAALEEFLRKVLDELRIQMKSGMYDGEALDPLKLDDMNLNPLVAGEVFDVAMQNITLSGLSEYRITQLESQIGESRMKLGLHYPKISANCMFAANGTIYDIFSVRGAGNATLVYNEVHAWTIIYFTRENGSLQVSSADQPYVDFSSASITFRDDSKGSGDVKADSVATQLGPLYFWILTASAVEKVDYPLALYLNAAMSKFTLPEVMQKLSFRQKFLRIRVPSHPLPYAYVSPDMK